MLSNADQNERGGCSDNGTSRQIARRAVTGRALSIRQQALPVLSLQRAVPTRPGLRRGGAAAAAVSRAGRHAAPSRECEGLSVLVSGAPGVGGVWRGDGPGCGRTGTAGL